MIFIWGTPFVKTEKKKKVMTVSETFNLVTNYGRINKELSIND